MNKLNELIKKCKGGLTLCVDGHLENYNSLTEYLSDVNEGFFYVKLSPEVMELMISKDTIIECVFYPFTPVHFQEVWHYDLDKCIDQCLEYFGK